MMKSLSVIACMAAVAAAHAISPASIPAAGTLEHGANGAFLAAASHFSGAYYNKTGTATAGPSFSAAHAIPSTIPGYGGKVGVTFWFCSESAGYTNAIGVRVGSKEEMVFANSKALKAGDHVSLNKGGAVDPALHFFALANIVKGNAQYKWEDAKGLNADKSDHLDISEFCSGGSLWYALALDDQFNGKGGKKGAPFADRDWNDCRVLVQLHPIAAPEPATVAMFLGFAAVAAVLWRRQRVALA